MVDVNLIVARARIAGGIQVEDEAPERLHIHAGDTVQVKFPFRFDETDDREDYQVKLEIQVDGESQEATFSGVDRPIVSDDRRGFVMVEHVFIGAGTHVLRYVATCQLISSEWKGGEAAVQETIAEGEVTIDVQ